MALILSSFPAFTAAASFLSSPALSSLAPFRMRYFRKAMIDPRIQK